MGYGFLVCGGIHQPCTSLRPWTPVRPETVDFWRNFKFFARIWFRLIYLKVNYITSMIFKTIRIWRKINKSRLLFDRIGITLTEKDSGCHKGSDMFPLSRAGSPQTRLSYLGSGGRARPNVHHPTRGQGWKTRNHKYEILILGLILNGYSFM